MRESIAGSMIATPVGALAMRCNTLLACSSRQKKMGSVAAALSSCCVNKMSVSRRAGRFSWASAKDSLDWSRARMRWMVSISESSWRWHPGWEYKESGSYRMCASSLFSEPCGRLRHRAPRSVLSGMAKKPSRVRLTIADSADHATSACRRLLSAVRRCDSSAVTGVTIHLIASRSGPSGVL